MRNIDSLKHTLGKSMYIDDIPEANNTAFLALYESPVACGSIQSLDVSKALKIDGVLAVLTAQDIPGQNQIGGIILDEPLLAENKVEFIGQPIAVIYATEKKIAEKALKAISCEIKSEKPVIDEYEAFLQKKFLCPSRSIIAGEVDKAWDQCAHIFHGSAKSGAQEHLYIETQGAYAFPRENGDVLIYSSTQAPTSVQKVCARVLGVGMQQIEVDVTRLGGGFGGKEDQANAVAVFAALGAKHLNMPTKFVMDRHEDMVATGKRHPYSCKFKIGLDETLKIKAYEVEFWQNGGAFADLSPAIMERSLFHSAGAYFIPHMKTTVHSCKTNLPPNTAFRGFGAPQAMFAIESAINLAANELGVDSYEIQTKNLLKTNDHFHYGQEVKKSYLNETVQLMEQKHPWLSTKNSIATFNKNNSRYKRGMSFFPLCFGISFTKSHMNQSSSLVHIYQDGSIGVNTAAVEMGQGVNTKIFQVVQSIFPISSQYIKINTTNTSRIANTSPTAASSAADLNGKATLNACLALRNRLAKQARIIFQENEIAFVHFDADRVSCNGKVIDWKSFVEKCFLARVNLSEFASYATPNIAYDHSVEKGTPFAYHVFGAAITIATIDRLLGTYKIDDVNIVHDFGQSMNIEIDQGQVEGALVQGIGWMTMEEIQYNADGKNLAATLSAYKVPDIDFVPEHVRIYPLDAAPEELAILGSKAVGEPPFMYGIGSYFAIQDAMKAAGGLNVSFDAPLTNEKLLLRLNLCSVK